MMRPPDWNYVKTEIEYRLAGTAPALAWRGSLLRGVQGLLARRRRQHVAALPITGGLAEVVQLPASCGERRQAG
jgi:hypothetical protein